MECPHCKQRIPLFRNPIPTVDIIIEVKTDEGGDGIVLIYRKNPPHGWAIPGGFVDYGESLEEAAAREAAEETSLKIRNLRQFRAYSDPSRDKRMHTVSYVFIARGEGMPGPGDDASEIGVFTQETLPSELAFDHSKILSDYFREKRGDD
jgi:ADP-ribose pyrophosphatase YjhB (NUDIX family)